MKRYKRLLAAIGMSAGLLLVPGVASAHGMTGTSSGMSEEQQGQMIYDQLQSKQTTCSALEDDEFELLGDFFMGRMMGESAHGIMDEQMAQYMGDAANTQVHVALGKRLSGCDTNASYPASAGKYPAMAGMTGVMGSGMTNGWNMMGASSSSWSTTDTTLAALLAVAVAAALFGWFRTSPKPKSKKKK